MNPTCNICDSSEKTVTYDQPHKLYFCKNCDHTFTLIDESYNEKEIYAEDYFDEEHKNWFKYPNYTLFNYIHQTIIAQLKKRDFNLIDVGCGRGDLLSYL